MPILFQIGLDGIECGIVEIGIIVKAATVLGLISAAFADESFDQGKASASMTVEPALEGWVGIAIRIEHRQVGDRDCVADSERTPLQQAASAGNSDRV
jgi:hypothetical protein